MLVPSFKLRKTFNQKSRQIFDGAFTPDDANEFVCLATKKKVCVFMTGFDGRYPCARSDGSVLERSPYFGIPVEFEVRAIEVAWKQHGGNTDIQSKSGMYTIVVAGDRYFEVIEVDSKMTDYVRIFTAGVEGQIECLRFCFDLEYVAFAVYETQKVMLYGNSSKHEICESSEKLGFYVWALQVHPTKPWICVAGDAGASIVCLARSGGASQKLEVVARIECEDILLTGVGSVQQGFQKGGDNKHDVGIMIMFEFYGDIVAATFSDNSFRVLKVRAENEMEIVGDDDGAGIVGGTTEVQRCKKIIPMEQWFVVEEKETMHVMPTVLFLKSRNCDIVLGCQNAKLTWWSIQNSSQL